MLYKKFQMLAQIVGCVTIALLAIYGLLMVLSGDSPVWAAIGQPQAAALASQEIPSTFNYQGFLREPDGSLTTGSYTITARIYDQATGGTALYTTMVPNVTVRDGLFNIVLGDDPSMSAEAFADVPRYIGISLDNDLELIPRQRVHAVPWALTAKTLVSNATLSGSVGIQTTAVPTFPLLVGKETGGTKVVLNDIDTARWGFDTHGYALSFRSDNCGGVSCGDDAATWPALFELNNDGGLKLPGNVGIQTTAVPTTPLLIGREDGETKFVLNEMPTARWSVDTVNYALKFRSDNCDGVPCGDDPATWPALFELKNDGSLNGDLSLNAVHQIGDSGSNDISQTLAYPVSLRRYIVESPTGGYSTPLSHTIVTDLCADADGCTFYLGLRDWGDIHIGRIKFSGPFKLSTSTAGVSARFSVSDANGDGEVADDNDPAQTTLRHFPYGAEHCSLNDHKHVGGSAQDDDEVGFWLYNWSTYANTVCVLIMED